MSVHPRAVAANYARDSEFGRLGPPSNYLDRRHPGLDRMLRMIVRALVHIVFARHNPARNRNPSAPDLYFGSIIEVFMQGCLGALRSGLTEELCNKLNLFNDSVRGFAFEGAAMGLGLLDVSSRRRSNRLEQFIAQTDRRHVYMAYIGLGWALAVSRTPIRRILDFTDPMLGWLVLDGCGFYYGFCHQTRCVLKQHVPRRFSLGYISRAFDQGLGRSLWFVHQGDVDRISNTISSFPLRRRGDLWSGIGLACSYAGGVEADSLELLTIVAREFLCELAQGAAFAAQARRRAQTPASHTRIACEIFCKMSAEEAAIITEACLEEAFAEGGDPAYEIWRERIRTRFR